MGITENYQQVLQTIPENVALVAVSKTRTVAEIKDIYTLGCRDFGENKVQELTQKYKTLPKDITWHFIGHLQSNKVKYIAPFVGLLHGIDSLKLLKTVNKEAIKNNRVIPCLLQLKIASEETKYGLFQHDLIELLEHDDFQILKNIRVVGLMGMATFTSDKQQVQEEFEYLKRLFVSIKQQYFTNSDYFKHISMGMSGDYTLAINCGSTMVRIGTTIFGERNYNK